MWSREEEPAQRETRIKMLSSYQESYLNDLSKIDDKPRQSHSAILVNEEREDKIEQLRRQIEKEELLFKIERAVHEQLTRIMTTGSTQRTSAKRKDIFSVAAKYIEQASSYVDSMESLQRKNGKMHRVSYFE